MEKIFPHSEFIILIGGALLCIATKFIPGIFLRLSAWNFFSLFTFTFHPDLTGIEENFLLYSMGGISFLASIFISKGKIDYIFSIILSLSIQEIFFRGFLQQYLFNSGFDIVFTVILTAVLSTLIFALQIEFKGLSFRDWRVGIFLFTWAALSGLLRFHFDSVIASVLFFLSLTFLIVLYLFFHP